METMMRQYLAAIISCVSCFTVTAQEMPAAQQRFVDINVAVSRSLENTMSPTVGSMLALLDRRSSALCQVAPQGVVANWFAIVLTIDSEEDKLELAMAPDVIARVARLPSEDGTEDLGPGARVSVSG